jgi:hypothetical protein
MRIAGNSPATGKLAGTFRGGDSGLGGDGQ